jgi:mevalonate kinase
MEPRAAHASAPGKVILFGEHAVVYGEPSLSLALERRIRVAGELGAESTTVNGEALDDHRHAYIATALRLQWRDGPVRLRTETELPQGGHVGSSAALSVATCAVLLRLERGENPPPADVARAAFETEYATQGAASPNDTTVATAGGAVLLNPTPVPGHEALWRIQKGERAWHAHRIELPPLPLVVAHSGVRARTADQVAKVRRFVERNAFGRDLLREIGQLTREGVQALEARDLRRLGELMNRNHECLHTLGVDSPALARLVDAARRVPGTLGAKLTGAGGGGSLIVLSERPQAVRDELARLGAQAFLATPSPRGLEVSA